MSMTQETLPPANDPLAPQQESDGYLDHGFLSCCRVLPLTSYNQVLLAEERTVVLFNADAYHVADQYRRIYGELLELGIFQAAPVAPRGSSS